MAGQVKARLLLEAAEQGDAALMQAIGSKSTGQAVPECLDGQVTHDAILDKFRECYEQLYNSAGTEDAMEAIKEQKQPSSV